jgi:hypothetical protein
MTWDRTRAAATGTRLLIVVLRQEQPDGSKRGTCTTDDITVRKFLENKFPFTIPYIDIQ